MIVSTSSWRRPPACSIETASKMASIRLAPNSGADPLVRGRRPRRPFWTSAKSRPRGRLQTSGSAPLVRLCKERSFRKTFIFILRCVRRRMATRLDACFRELAYAQAGVDKIVDAARTSARYTSGLTLPNSRRQVTRSLWNLPENPSKGQPFINAYRN